MELRTEAEGATEKRCFIARSTQRDGHARYALKRLKKATLSLASSHKEDKRLLFTAGVADLAIEAKFLAVLKHPNIIKMRGMASVHPCSDEFFIVLDRLNDTLEDRIHSWKKSVRRLSGGLGLVLDTRGGKKDKMFSDRLCVAYAICSALHYLHSKR